MGVASDTAVACTFTVLHTALFNLVNMGFSLAFFFAFFFSTMENSFKSPFKFISPLYFVVVRLYLL